MSTKSHYRLISINNHLSHRKACNASMVRKVQVRYSSEVLTVPACAKTIGKDKHDTTIPVVKNIHSSTQALLAESKLLDMRREMMVGTGTRK